MSSPKKPQASPMTGNFGRHIFTKQVLTKYEVDYFLDVEIGYIYTEHPYWLKEAYSDAIAVTDTGALTRNIRNFEIVCESLSRSKSHVFVKGVDIGSGYGIFVRAMRDAGWSFFWSDPFAPNLLARGFEARDGQYTTAVAFEVLEHTVDPLSFIQEQRERFGFDLLFFSATCIPDNGIPDQRWWYWAFETGQHISFFSKNCLEWMATQLGMELSHVRDDIFVFSADRWKVKPKSWIDRLVAPLIEYRRRKALQKSLTFKDHIWLRNRLRDVGNCQSDHYS